MCDSLKHRRVAIVELTLVFTLVMAIIWQVIPRDRAFWGGLAIFALIVFGFVYHRREFRKIIRAENKEDGNRNRHRSKALRLVGIQPRDFSQFWRMFLWAAIAWVVIVGSGLIWNPEIGTGHDFWKVVHRHFRGYFLWGFFQQILLAGYFANMLFLVLRRASWSALVAGAVFMLAHLPNPILTVACSLFGAAGTYYFLKSRNIYLLTFFHAVFGTTIKYALAKDLLDHGMRVGPGFWQ